MSQKLDLILSEIKVTKSETQPIEFFRDKKDEVDNILVPIKPYVRKIGIKNELKSTLY